MFSRNRFGRRPGRRPANHTTRLRCELLESREVPTVTVNPIANMEQLGGKDLYIGLTPTAASTPNGPVKYLATSSSPNVSVTVIEASETRPTWELTVSGKDGDGNDFSGVLTFQLFGDIAPLTVGRITTLTNGAFYDGLTFHRVLDGFVAQGGDPQGDGSGGSSFGNIPDEYSAGLAFTSPGLLAMAKVPADDTANSQFFITDTDVPLDGMPQHLNFQHTIFGVLTSGFDTFTKLMSTDVNSPQVGTPINTVRIDNAEIKTVDTVHAVLKVSAPPGFVGTSQVSVTATDNDGTSTPEPFSVTVETDTINDRAFLGTVAPPTTTVGTGITIDLPAVDLENDPLTYTITDPANFSARPANVTITIDHAARRATLSPAPGFVGTISMLVGVRDQTARGQGVALDDISQFDTQRLTLTVNGSIDLPAADDDGALNDDNVTGIAGPTLTIFATPNQSVQVSVNGGDPIPATQTATAGTYTVTLPAGQLQVGVNTIAATAGSTTLSPMTLTYSPPLSSIYVVPGALGSSQQLQFDYAYTESFFKNGVGVYKVDDLAGTVGGIAPGQPGYADAVKNSPSRQVLFTGGSSAGATTSLNFRGGELLAFYLIQNDSPASDAPTFFSIPGANSDGVAHVRAVDDPLNSQVAYNWEDVVGGGDRDYNDLVLTIRKAGDAPGEAIRIVAGTLRDVQVAFKVQPAEKSKANAAPTTTTALPGEVGLFVVDDETGRVGNLRPGDRGYLAAALDPARRQVLFSSGAAVDASKTVKVVGGSFVGFYIVPGGTATEVLTANPNNLPTGDQKLAYFSFDAANPDGKEHFRTIDPELVTTVVPTADAPVRLHFMTKFNGTAADFDDAVLTMEI